MFSSRDIVNNTCMSRDRLGNRAPGVSYHFILTTIPNMVMLLSRSVNCTICVTVGNLNIKPVVLLRKTRWLGAEIVSEIVVELKFP